MNAQVVDDLRALKELFSVSERWTKKTLARDSVNCPVYPTSSVAACWCIEGGIEKVTSTPDPRESSTRKTFLTIVLKSNLDPKSCTKVLRSWNDFESTDFEDLHGLIDRTITCVS